MKLKDLVKQAGGSGSDLWNIPVEMLDANPNNLRLDSPALREHIAGLAESIQERGFLRARPLTVRQDGERLTVVDGNCRLLAVRLAMSRGAEIRTLPCLSEAPNTSDADRTLNMLLANSGMQHTPAEYAAAINRLLSYGWSDGDVARKLGRSRQWVANVLETAAMPEEVQQLVVNGAVSGTLARQLVRSEGAGAAETIKRAAGTTGRAHVTARHLKIVRTDAESATPPAPEPDAVQDELIVLRQAVRGFLREWDLTEVGDFRGTIATLRSLVR
jgi:ParB family transcriptional regulator, chromosome partitioning protein